MMRYIKPPDFKSVREFQAHYQKIEKDITALLTTDGSARTAKELNEKISAALSSAISYLSSVNRDFTKNELPNAFNEGKGSLKDVPKKLSEREAAEVLEKQGYKYAKNGLSRDTYIELQSATQAAGNGLKSRVNSIIDKLHKTGQDSVYNVQQAIAKDLNEHSVFEVKYSNGAKMPLWAYAAMAARSARIESANIGAIGRALEAGTDLVKMTTMPQCCKLCGAYQGKVYSVSGEDKRFPALFKTVLRSGYALPHPNCRHEFIPWFEEMESLEDVKEAIKNSKIKYDRKGNLVDVRYQRDIEGYAEWQAGNRQLNRELLEYNRMKEYYGESSPYKTLGAFRREVRTPYEKQSPAMRAWKRHYSDAKQYESWKDVVGAENMPKTLAKFQEMKYNRNTQEQYARLEKTFQGYSAYKRDNLDATPSDYRAVCRLKKQGFEGNIHIPPRKVDSTEYGYSSGHINNEHHREISREESESFIERAIVSIEQGKKGRRQVFYSTEGAVVIDTVEKRIVTSWKRNEYDQKTKTIIKEVTGSGEE